MSETHDLFEALGNAVDENTSDEGIDMVNIYVTIVEALKENPDMTIEMWEDLRLTVNNGVTIFNNLVDEELVKLRAKDLPDLPDIDTHSQGIPPYLRD